MSTVLWVLGVWLLVSLPFGMFIGWICSLNGLDGEQLPISHERPITTAPAADYAAVGAIRIPA
jgi:hypothetical protein